MKLGKIKILIILLLITSHWLRKIIYNESQRCNKTVCCGQTFTL